MRMHRAAVVILLFVVCDSFATEWSPFLGLAFQRANVGQHHDKSGSDGPPSLSGLRIHVGNGYAAELGLRSNRFDVHLGFRYGQVEREEAGGTYQPITSTPPYPHYISSEIKSAWTDWRIFLGGRMNLIRPGRTFVSPFIGAGASGGWIGYEIDETEVLNTGDVARFSWYRKSPIRFGGFLETGVAVPIEQRISVSLSAEFDRIYADFGPYERTYMYRYDDWVTEWLAEVGVTVHP